MSTRIAACRRGGRCPPYQRRGMSLIVVLVVLSVSMALACAVLRTQGATVQLARNTDRRDAARRAALSGLTAAIRRMHVQSDWQGVGTTWSGSLSSTQSFSVNFTAGDASLTSSSPNYADYPYRVTVLSTGYAQDPANSAVVTTYTARAVMRLVPKKLADEPTGWSSLAPFTFYQWNPPGSTSTSTIFQADVPCRFEGAVRIRDQLSLCPTYPGAKPSRGRLLKDFNGMRTANMGDYRPFNGPLHVPAGMSQRQRDRLTQLLGLSLQNTTSTDAVGWSHPGSVTTYQVYPGGPVYNVTVISTTQQNTTLQADPVTNPLGLFYCPDRLYVYENVTVRGTIITNTSVGDIFIEGVNVQMSPVNLPALDGTTTPVQLPVVVVRNDLRIFGDSKGSIQGMAVVWNEVEFKGGGQQSIDFTVEGRLLGRQLYVRGRDEWDRGSSWWSAAYNSFLLAEQLTGPKLFPVWLQSVWGLQYTPRVRIKPAATAVTYHWKNAADPIYVPHPADAGLRWDIVDWKENP